jgi:hypothetical protein
MANKKKWPQKRIDHPGPMDRMRGRSGFGPAAKGASASGKENVIATPPAKGKERTS